MSSQPCAWEGKNANTAGMIPTTEHGFWSTAMDLPISVWSPPNALTHSEFARTIEQPAVSSSAENVRPIAARAPNSEKNDVLTGITVNWEVVPLDQVLAKVSQDAATQAGANDIYYFDQAWVGQKHLSGIKRLGHRRDCRPFA